MKKRALLLALVIALYSCAASVKEAQTGSERPKWVDNPGLLYAENKFLTAIGTGDTRAAAEDNARGGIAKIFQSDIKLDQTLVENIRESDEEYSKSLDMLTQTNVQANQSLKNLRIGESWFSQNEGRYYVVAYLNRFETAMLYTEEIDANHMRAEGAYGKSTQAKTPFARYAFLRKASEGLRLNQLLVAQLRIISPATAVMEGDGLNSQVNDALRQAKGEITCFVQSEGDMQEETAASLRDLIGDYGFPINTEETDAALVFKASVTRESTTLNSPGIYFLYNLTVDLYDNLNRQNLDTFQSYGREGHINESSAIKRVAMAIDKDIHRDLRKQLEGYIRSFVE
jgi:hypothetical protein